MLTLMLQAVADSSGQVPVAPPNPLSWREFGLGMVEALAWPLVALCIAFIFRKPIKTLLNTIDTLRVGSLVAEIKQAKREAVATIENLKELAQTLAAPIGGSLAGVIEGKDSYSIQSPSVIDRLQHGQSIVEALVKLGIDREKATEIALEPLWRHIRDAHIGWLETLVAEAERPDLKGKILSLKGFDLTIIQRLHRKEIGADEARILLIVKLGDIQGDVLEWLDDLDYFERTKQLRRPHIIPWAEKSE